MKLARNMVYLKYFIAFVFLILIALQMQGKPHNSEPLVIRKAERKFKCSVRHNLSCLLVAKLYYGKRRFTNGDCVIALSNKNVLYTQNGDNVNAAFNSNDSTLSIVKSVYWADTSCINYSLGRPLAHDNTYYIVKYFNGNEIIAFLYYDCFLCEDYKQDETNTFIKLITHLNKLYFYR